MGMKRGVKFRLQFNVICYDFENRTQTLPRISNQSPSWFFSTNNTSLKTWISSEQQGS